MRTEAEGHVRVGLSVEPHLGGVLEDSLILIGGGPTKRDTAARWDGHALHLGFHRTHTADVSERCHHSEKLLGRMDYPGGILAQKLQRLRVAGQVAKN